MRHFESASEANVLFVRKNSARIPAPALGNELWDKSRLVSRLSEPRSFLSRMAGNLRPFDRRANSLRDLFFLRACASSFWLSLSIEAETNEKDVKLIFLPRNLAMRASPAFACSLAERKADQYHLSANSPSGVKEGWPIASLSPSLQATRILSRTATFPPPRLQLLKLISYKTGCLLIALARDIAVSTSRLQRLKSSECNVLLAMRNEEIAGTSESFKQFDSCSVYSDAVPSSTGTIFSLKNDFGGKRTLSILNVSSSSFPWIDSAHHEK